MDRIVKSVLYLAGFGGLGYSLLTFCNPSSNKDLTQYKNYPGFEKNPVERVKEKQRFVNIIQSASESEEPVYMSKEQFQKLCQK